MQPLDYAIARLSDSDDIARLLAQVFSESDPPAVAMALSFEEIEQFLRVVVPNVIADGLTVIARSKDTGKVAGAMLSDDFASPPAADPGQISSKLLPILSMLDSLDEQFRRGKTIARGQYLHLFMLGVDSQFAGRGVGQGVVESSIENAVQMGYRIALTEATGRVSQHIFRKNGFVERFSMSYQDFIYENKKVFASIQDHDQAILMERVLV
ncbi:MAG: GNAT family N-acetyltransferase [Candidatus Korobacteraceae bacterium]